MDEKGYPIHVTQRDDGIIVFRFNRSDRIGADYFAQLVRASQGNLPASPRIIYDLSHCPPPTPYFLALQTKLYHEIDLPDDSRSAYIFPHAEAQIWGRIIRHDYKEQKEREETHFFTDFDEAVAWLQSD